MADQDKAKCSPVAAETDKYKLTGYAPTLVIAPTRMDEATDYRIEVNSPDVKSLAQVSGGAIVLNAMGKPDIGKRGEPRVRKSLVKALQAAHVTVEYKPGAKDQDGEDGILTVDGEQFLIQIVTLPADSSFWHEVGRGQRATRGFPNVDEQVATIRQAIESKTGGEKSLARSTRRRFILALDALHAGPLASKKAQEAYLERHGCPAVEFGFASVWIVGPTLAQCVRLGGGVI